MVYVCDAIMGTGKSQSAIAYMNEHKDEKFIYITPYLEEARRIKEGCPELKFVEPSNKMRNFNNRKLEHTAYLIKRGRNITTTHQSFKRYTSEMIEDIKHHGYTLMIDENVDVLEVLDYDAGDFQMAVEAGYVLDDDGTYSRTNKPYTGRLFKELFGFLNSRELIKIEDENNNALYYWALPPELFLSFKNVFILTYLFKGQSLHHFLEIYNIPYEYIGIEKTSESPTGFGFADYPGYTPEYVSNLKNMLHIMDVEKLNSIGDDYYALSMHWFQKNPEEIKQLKNNTYNYFRNIWKDVPTEERLWATYNAEYGKMRGKGYTKSFLTFNSKATNAYRDKTHLVYLVNIFMNVNEQTFYEKHGVEIDRDLFALSIMVQWIWRSAIRDGHEVYIYIPSRRMRELLTNWIDKVSQGGNYIE